MIKGFKLCVTSFFVSTIKKMNLLFFRICVNLKLGGKKDDIVMFAKDYFVKPKENKKWTTANILTFYACVVTLSLVIASNTDSPRYLRVLRHGKQGTTVLAITYSRLRTNITLVRVAPICHQKSHRGEIVT